MGMPGARRTVSLRSSAEVLIDCEEDRTLRAMLVGMLREITDRTEPVGVRNSDHALDLQIRSGRRRRASDSKDAREASVRHSIRLPWLPNCPSAEPLRAGLESLGLRSQPTRLAAGFSLGLQGSRFAPI